MSFIRVLLNIMKALPLTLTLALTILVISLVLGFLITLILDKKIPIIDSLIRLYIAVFRGSPLLVQLFIFYFSMPRWIKNITDSLGVDWDKNNLSPIVIVIVSFSIYYAAYQQETVRGAFSSVKTDQKELADSLGYSGFQKLMKVILPQSFVYALPNIFNSFLSIMKALSVAFTVSVVDLFAKAKLESSLGGGYLQSFVAVALIYWGVCLAATVVFKRFEKAIIPKEKNISRNEERVESEE